MRTPPLPRPARGEGDDGEEIRTTCPYCGVGCGVKVTVDNDGQAQVAGDEHHPANFGRLMFKGRGAGRNS